MDEIKKYNKLNFFFKLESDTKPKIVQNKIKEYRRNIKIRYEKEPNFYKIMPTIERQSRMNNIYQTLIKNGIKSNSCLIRLIYKTIMNIEERCRNENLNKIKKKIKLYKLPSIKELKTKKEIFEKKNMKKIKLIKLEKKKYEDYKALIRKKLFSSSTTKNFDNNIIRLNLEKEKLPNMRNNISFNNKELSISPSGTRINTESIKDSSIIFTKKNESNSNSFFNEKSNNSFIISNFNKSMDIIKKCDKGIKKGNYVNNFINNYKIDLDRSIKLRVNRDDLIDMDHEIMQEKNKIKNKYIKLEEKRIKKIKESKEEKMSENFAYENRKEFVELIKKDDIKALSIQIKEIKKMNENLKKRFKEDKKQMKKVIEMADAGLKRTISFKNKIDIINKKNRSIDKMTNLNLYLNSLKNSEKKSEIKGILFDSFNEKNKRVG